MSALSTSKSNTMTATVGKEELKKEGTKPKAKCSAYAYYVKLSKKSFQDSNPGQKVTLPEFTKQLAEQWKNMTEAEKKDFNELAERDRQRYETEMAAFDPSFVAEKKRKRPAKDRDPDAPKRPLTAFFLYSSENRENVKNENKEMTSSGVAKQLGAMWKGLTQEERDSFTQRAEKERQTYLSAVEQYKKSKVSTDDREDNKENAARASIA